MNVVEVEIAMRRSFAAVMLGVAISVIVSCDMGVVPSPIVNVWFAAETMVGAATKVQQELPVESKLDGVVMLEPAQAYESFTST